MNLNKTIFQRKTSTKDLFKLRRTSATHAFVEKIARWDEKRLCYVTPELDDVGYAVPLMTWMGGFEPLEAEEVSRLVYTMAKNLDDLMGTPWVTQ